MLPGRALNEVRQNCCASPQNEENLVARICFAEQNTFDKPNVQFMKPRTKLVSKWPLNWPNRNKKTEL
jgi:hypothetical protein